MSKVGDVVNRLLGRSVVDLAQAVDDALAHLAFCKGQQAEAQEFLRVADEDVAQAQRLLATARDALFDEHPELGMPSYPGPTPPHHEGVFDVSHPMPQQTIPEGLNPDAFDPIPIEVDDDNDERFTSGAAPVSAVDGDPLPDVVWEEHDE